jgi:predicted transcriptional regulator
MGEPMIENVAAIVTAFVKRNPVPATELPALIASVSQTLAGLGQPPAPTAPIPAVPIRRAVSPEAITCLDCGWRGKMLRRHLTTAHRLDPDAYRAKWGLSPGYPMTAANYSERRSELAKHVGLGRHRARRREGA